MRRNVKIRDFVFGDNILPSKRLEQYQARLSGVYHHFEAQPAQPRPGQAISLWVTVACNEPVDRIEACYTLDDSEPHLEESAKAAFHLESILWDEIGWQYAQRWRAELPGQPEGTMIRYRIAAHSFDGNRWIYADNQAEEEAQATNFALWVSSTGAPGWSRRAMIYHVFVDRFSPGGGKNWLQTTDLNGFCGGTLQGVIEKLDYIQELGYNTLWLSPFFRSNSHHGYDAIDMYQVEPRLGTNADLEALITAAHRRGLRLILDFVANHWSNLHFSMQAAQRNRQSEYYDWYFWKQWPDRYEGYFDLLEMPKLNLNPGMPARKYLLDCAQHWLEKGFDGFRLDFAYGPPVDFWVDFRRRCKTTRPDCWLFGEVILNPSLQRAFQVCFDGQIDFMLADALRQAIGYKTLSLPSFDAFLERHEAFFGETFDRLVMLDNHDMNRFLFLAGNDQARLKLAALVLYTLRGFPINYYGTEVGVSQPLPIHHDGHGYFEMARSVMLWGEARNSDLFEYFRKLAALRRQQPVLWNGSRRTVHLDARRGTYAYERSDGQSRLLVVLNDSRRVRRLKIDLPGFDGRTDLLGGAAVNRRSTEIEITLAPQSGAIIG